MTVSNKFLRRAHFILLIGAWMLTLTLVDRTLFKLSRLSPPIAAQIELPICDSSLCNTVFNKVNHYVTSP
jgi:hypothetical protein